jgi:hypothetical protein
MSMQRCFFALKTYNGPRLDPTGPAHLVGAHDPACATTLTGALLDDEIRAVKNGELLPPAHWVGNSMRKTDWSCYYFRQEEVLEKWRVRMADTEEQTDAPRLNADPVSEWPLSRCGPTTSRHRILLSPKHGCPRHSLKPTHRHRRGKIK